MRDAHVVYAGATQPMSRSSIIPLPHASDTASPIPPSQNYYLIKERSASLGLDESAHLLGNPPPTIWSRFIHRFKFGKLILVAAGLTGVFTVMFIVLGSLHVFQNRNYRNAMPGFRGSTSKYEGKSWGVATSEEFTLRGQGDGTYYDPGIGVLACGTSFTASDMVVALNHLDFGSDTNPNESPVCGGCIKITGPRGTTKATIQDKCPGCGRGSLDLSPAVFDQIGDFTVGRIAVFWEPC